MGAARGDTFGSRLTTILPHTDLAQLDAMPDPTHLPRLPMFPVGPPPASGLDVLAIAATESPVQTALHSCHSLGVYNPAVSLPPKVVKKVLDLDFIEMAEVRANI